MTLRKKALSMLLTLAMILNMGMPAFAVEGGVVGSPIGTSSVCEHHIELDEAGAYAEGETRILSGTMTIDGTTYHFGTDRGIHLADFKDFSGTPYYR